MDATLPPDPPALTQFPAELRRRHERLSAGLDELGAGCLVTAREGAVTYLTGFWSRTWSNFSRPIVAVLRADGALTVVCAETEADAVAERVPGVVVAPYVELRPVAPSARLPDGRVQFAPHAAEALAGVLAGCPAGAIAVDNLDAAFPPVADLTSLVEGVADRLVDASALLWRERLRKSAWEVERMQAAADVLARAFAAFEPRLRPGLTEREVHGLLAAESFAAGADLLGYTNVVAGVERGLFGSPTRRVWKAGDVLYVDGGVTVDGYWADFCRMYVVGAPSAAQAAGYARARDGLTRALERVDTTGTAGDLARTIAVATDLDPGAVGFGRFGHGIGLYMPEPPSLHPLDDTPLADGLVLCVEPAVKHDGANYVVEEEHVVRDGTLMRLSPPAPQELISI